MSKKNPVPLDILKQEIEVGDYICLNPPKYKGIAIGIVTKTRPNSVTCKYAWSICKEMAYECNRPSSDVVKVSEAYAKSKIENAEFFI